MNVPWAGGGFGDADYIYAFQKVIMPIAYEFAPDFVISELSDHPKSRIEIPVSAGFDAALGDELGRCEVTPAGYAHMTHMLCALAGGKVACVLEVSLCC